MGTGRFTVPAPMVINPRPFGQMLGDATLGLGRVWKVLLWPALLISIPVGALTIMAFSVTGGDEFMDLALNNPGAFDLMTDDELFDTLIPFYIAIGISLLLQAVLGVFLNLAAARAVAMDIAGEEITTAKVSSQALSRFGKGLLATLAIGITVVALLTLGVFLWSVPFVSVGTPNGGSVLVALVLFFALLAPAVWAAISVSMTQAVIGVEDRSAMASIQRSMRLVRGRWWVTAGFLALVGLLGGVAIQLIQLVAFPFAATGSGGVAVLLGAVLGVLAQGVIIVLIGVTYTYWYIDLRARKETLTTENLS